MNLGIMTLPGYKFAPHTARMYRFASEDATRTGWGFFIAAEPPFEEPPFDKDEGGIFWLGAALYAEDEPIPLPEMPDFTGLDFYLKEPCQPEHGDVYFTFNAGEAQDVSEVRLRFLERDAGRYRVSLSALVHHVFEEPTELRYDGWIEVVEKEQAGDS